MMLRARFDRQDSSTFAAKARRLFESGASHGAMKLTLGAVAATAGIGAFSAPLMAQAVVIEGDTTGAATFDSPNANGTSPPVSTAGSATFPYQAYTLTATTSGNTTFIESGSAPYSIGDAYLALYGGSFNPAAPLTNALQVNDDDGPGLDAQITQNLTAGNAYVAVPQSFSGGVGTYSLTIDQPMSIATTLASNANTTISTNTGIITAPDDGIFVSALGGATTINVANLIFATNQGVDVSSTSGAINVNQTAIGSVIAGSAGAIDLTSASGNIGVATQGIISGGSAAGINAVTGGNVTVSSTGSITGAEGVYAETTNGGNLSVKASNVTSSTGDGITAINSAAGANAGTINVTLNGGTALVSANNGIVTNSGVSTGATTINVDGEIDAVNTGVQGTSTVGAITVNVATAGKIDPLIGVDLSTVSGTLAVNNAGLIEGDQHGVRLTASGAGDLNIDSAGAINGLIGNGITANTAGGDIDFKLDDVSGAVSYGVYAHTNAAGTIDITANGSITGGGMGIDAQNDAGNLSVTNNSDITGGVHGIYAQTNTGTLTIDGAGTWDGNAGSGIRIQNAFGDTSINITGAVTGATEGI